MRTRKGKKTSTLLWTRSVEDNFGGVLNQRQKNHFSTPTRQAILDCYNTIVPKSVKKHNAILGDIHLFLSLNAAEWSIVSR
jgi:hypothetical protein